MAGTETILEVKNLSTYFMNEGGSVLRAADGLSYSVRRGECVAIIGESGSGKSVGALSVMRLIPYPPGLTVDGEILFHGKNILDMTDDELADFRGSKIAMIFQEASTALNPVMPIGKQIAEALRAHNPSLTKKEAKDKAIELLRKVKIPNPEERAKQYPFEFSGGMQQRAMIAMAMCCEPEILFADEPTTALDVTVQAQVLEELNNLRRENNMAMVIITHNLGIVARYAESVKIMYGGKIVEEGSPRDIFLNPHHPYTLGLIRAVPRLDLPRSHGLHAIEGEPPDMSKVPPQSCAFAPRCQYATEECRNSRPQPEEVEPGHFCSCFHSSETAKERSELV